MQQRQVLLEPVHSQDVPTNVLYVKMLRRVWNVHLVKKKKERKRSNGAWAASHSLLSGLIMSFLASWSLPSTERMDAAHYEQRHTDLEETFDIIDARCVSH